MRPDESQTRTSFSVGATHVCTPAKRTSNAVCAKGEAADLAARHRLRSFFGDCFPERLATATRNSANAARCSRRSRLFNFLPVVGGRRGSATFDEIRSRCVISYRQTLCQAMGVGPLRGIVFRG